MCVVWAIEAFVNTKSWSQVRLRRDNLDNPWYVNNHLVVMPMKIGYKTHKQLWVAEDQCKMRSITNNVRLFIKLSEQTVKGGGNHSTLRLGSLNWGRKLGVAPRSSDLSPMWLNILKDNGEQPEGVIDFICIFQNMNNIPTGIADKFSQENERSVLTKLRYENSKLCNTSRDW